MDVNKPRMLDPFDPRRFDLSEEPDFELQSREVHEINRKCKAGISYLIKESKQVRKQIPNIEKSKIVEENLSRNVG